MTVLNEFFSHILYKNKKVKFMNKSSSNHNLFSENRYTDRHGIEHNIFHKINSEPADKDSIYEAILKTLGKSPNKYWK